MESFADFLKQSGYISEETHSKIQSTSVDTIPDSAFEKVASFIQELKDTEFSPADEFEYFDKASSIVNEIVEDYSLKSTRVIEGLNDITVSLLKNYFPIDLEKKASALNNKESGPSAVFNALRELDLESLKKSALDDLRSGKKTKRRRAVSLLNIITGTE